MNKTNETLTADNSAPSTPSSNRLERSLESLIFTSRWLQAPIYIGIAMILFAFIYLIFKDIYLLFSHINTLSDENLIITALTICDLGLIANLIIIVVISGYENFVSKLDIKHSEGEPIWIKRLKHSDVKMKILGSIVAISSIQLLKILLMKNSPTHEVILAITIQVVFVLSALVLAFISVIEKKYNPTHEEKA